MADQLGLHVSADVGTVACIPVIPSVSLVSPILSGGPDLT